MDGVIAFRDAMQNTFGLLDWLPIADGSIQRFHVPGGPLPGDHAHNEAVFRIQRDMIPVVTAPLIGWVFGGAVLLLLAHECPFFIELHLPGVRGKKPRVRRGVVGHVDRPGGCIERRCPC